MSIVHKGIRRHTTDLLDDYGEAYYAQNWRYSLTGEMGRRAGIGKTDMAKIDGPVKLIGVGGIFEPFIIQLTSTGSLISTKNARVVIGDPIVPPPIKPFACARFVDQVANGTSGDVTIYNFTLPKRSCAGRIIVVSTESDDPRRAGSTFGYTFTYEADGNPLGASGCLINDSEETAYPAGTRTVTVTVEGGCGAGVIEGSYSITVTTP